MTDPSRDERLIRANRLIKAGQVAAGNAHEINNLLAPLLWHLELLDRALCHVDIPGVQRSLAAALDAALRIRAVAQDTLSLVRPGPRRRSAVDLNQVVTDACRLARPSLEPGARLVVESQRVPRVMADDVELVQLVLNLLLNALGAFGEPVADRNEVRVRVWSEDASVCLEVRDNGRGMSPEVAQRAFDAFFTMRSPGEGAGLGLWVCHDIAQRHDGSIELDSQVGVGTRVVLRLPVGPVGDDPERDSS